MVRHSSKGFQRGEEARSSRTPAFADGPVRRAVVEIFDAAQRAAREQGWYRAAEGMGRRLREARQLHSSDRRQVGDALHQLVRGLRRLRVLSGHRQPGALQLYLTWLLDEAGDAPPEGLWAAARAAGIDAAALPARRAALSDAEALSYPDWLCAALAEDLGTETARMALQAQNQRAPLTVRANTIKVARTELAERLRAEGVPAGETPIASAGLILRTRVNIYGLAPFREGLMEIQDEGSQLIAELAAPPKGSMVVDACAGAGGKTLALSALMANTGRLLALDVDEDKLAELRKRARRAGLTNVQALRVPPEGPLPLAARADRVLVDAPCSGLGVLRRNPEARWRLQPRDLDELPLKQRAILERAARLVGPGGRLIYATCTLLRRENDAVVEDFLRAHPDFVEMPAKEILGGARAAQLGDGTRLRLLPGGGDGPDGFFAAVLRRPEERTHERSED